MIQLNLQNVYFEVVKEERGEKELVHIVDSLVETIFKFQCFHFE